MMTVQCSITTSCRNGFKWLETELCTALRVSVCCTFQTADLDMQVVHPIHMKNWWRILPFAIPELDFPVKHF